MCNQIEQGTEKIQVNRTNYNQNTTEVQPCVALTTQAFLIIGLVFTFVNIIFNAINIILTPVSAIVGIDGLVLWNAIAGCS